MFIFKKYILFFLILIFNFNVVNATPLVNKDWLKQKQRNVVRKRETMMGNDFIILQNDHHGQ